MATAGTYSDTVFRCLFGVYPPTLHPVPEGSQQKHSGFDKEWRRCKGVYWISGG
jgi:hypothetical protein